MSGTALQSGGIIVHATTVALGSNAALLRGPSGAGKSDLALRFLADEGRWPSASDGRRLVADDQTQLTSQAGRLIASAPQQIAGLLEVRGLGIVPIEDAIVTEVCVVIDLVAPTDIERMPDQDATVALLGIKLPLRLLSPFEASATIKLALMILAARGDVTDGRSR